MVSLKAVNIIFLFIAAGALFSCDSRPMNEKTPGAIWQIDLAKTRKIATVSQSFLSPEMDEMRKSSHESTVEIALGGSGYAYVEPIEGKFRVIHNGNAGKPYFAVSELSLSKDGKRHAYVARVSETEDRKEYRVVVDGEERTQHRENDNQYFSSDGKYHIATVTEGDSRYIVIENKIYRDYSLAQGPVIRSDPGLLAFSSRQKDGKKQFIISDMNLQNRQVYPSCGEHIIPNTDLSRLAVVCLDAGKSSVKVVDFQSREILSHSEFDGTITHLSFSPDNRSLSYSVWKDQKERFILYGDKKEKIPDGDEFMSDPLVLSEPESVGVIVGNYYQMRLYRAFQNKNKNGRIYGFISDFVTSKDGRNHAYIAVNAGPPLHRIVVNGNEGPTFDKIVSPVFSPDGNHLAYRARQDGKRFLVVSDMKGKVVRRHKDYAMVFQPVFSADGASVAYGVLDGNELWWKVEKVGE